MDHRSGSRSPRASTGGPAQLACNGIRRTSCRLDHGQLYLTNKRLLYLGDKQNRTIRLSQIVDFSVYNNGVEIEKDRGRSPFLGMAGENDVFAALLGRAISDSAG